MKQLLVVSSYPERGFTHGVKTVGVASYTKNTLVALNQYITKKNEPYTITVLADTITGQQSSYTEKGIVVSRIWKRNYIPSFIRLLTKIALSPAQDVMVPFEFTMFGDTWSVAFVPLLLAWIRLLGKQVTVISHHAVTDLSTVSGHTNTAHGSFGEKVGTQLLKMFYRIMLFLATHVVVFDEVFKNSLALLGNSEKIVVIPHGVEETKRTLSKSAARKKLGIKSDEFVLVSFGYLAWYKGSDWLAKTVASLPNKFGNKKIRLILAGGPNPNRQNWEYYQSYCADIAKIAKKSNGNISVTGFVPEKNIGEYYQAADLLVFPYRAIFSSSGPLSIACSYEKPCIISKKMEHILRTADMDQALRESHATKDSLVFSMNKQSLQETIKRIIIEKETRESLVRLSQILKEKRAFGSIAKDYFSFVSHEYARTSPVTANVAMADISS